MSGLIDEEDVLKNSICKLCNHGHGNIDDQGYVAVRQHQSIVLILNDLHSSYLFCLERRRQLIGSV